MTHADQDQCPHSGAILRAGPSGGLTRDEDQLFLSSASRAKPQSGGEFVIVGRYQQWNIGFWHR